jgi:hypothetical protein
MKQFRTAQHYMDDDPLRLAVLYYNSPLPRFEEIVKENRSWIDFPAGLEDADSVPSILSVCAGDGLTGHVEVLIRNGADVGQSLAWEDAHGSPDARDLIAAVARRLGCELQSNAAAQEAHSRVSGGKLGPSRTVVGPASSPSPRH